MGRLARTAPGAHFGVVYPELRTSYLCVGFPRYPGAVSALACRLRSAYCNVTNAQTETTSGRAYCRFPSYMAVCLFPCTDDERNGRIAHNLASTPFHGSRHQRNWLAFLSVPLRLFISHGLTYPETSFSPPSPCSGPYVLFVPHRLRFL